MVSIPTNQAPTHPGEMLSEEFLDPLVMTQRELVEAIGVPYQQINEIVNDAGSNPARLSGSPGTSARQADSG